MKSLLLLLSVLVFISCSNMTVGFEEDSPFYNGPVIDTRTDSDSQEREATEAKVEKESKKEVAKPKSVEIKAVEEKATNEESQTTFTYERDDE